MTAIELYRFVDNTNSEFHYNHGETDVRLFVDNHNISEFNKLLGANIMDEDGIDCTMKSGYFCFEMKDICDYFGIELKEVFDKEKEI